MGKGRTLAAIILDAWLQGNQKAIWVSASADLFADAKRDLQAVCTAIAGTPPLHELLINLTSVPQHVPITAARGVLFASYALLARPGRLAQVLAWCTARVPFQGVLSLDECHRAKAASATGAGSAIIHLQSQLPLARVVYSSATCATELHNLEYLCRLGLWGRGTPFASFNAFLEQMQAGGTAAKELLPLHLKMCGSLVSRLISYDGVRVRVTTHRLTHEQAIAYDAATCLWYQLALVLRRRASLLPSSTTSRFWSAHQRFFRCLVTACKLPTLHALLDAGLAAGKSIVIGLQGTGEAYHGTEDKEAGLRENYAKATSFDPAHRPGEGSTNSGNFAFAGLPAAPSAILKSVLTSVLFPGDHTTCGELRRWLEAADALRLPANPLDEIMSSLATRGVPVVELSGRQEVAAQRNVRDTPLPVTDFRVHIEAHCRICATSRQHHFHVPCACTACTRALRLVQAARERFQSGQALVAVISDAASTGVSLHAPMPRSSHAPVRPRLHITLELNWSADRQIQQLGRTHRTGQAYPPEHVLIVTDVCGEKRFVSTVARRLRSLGALSGDGGGAFEGLQKVLTDLMLYL